MPVDRPGGRKPLQYFHLDKVDSTNDRAKELYRKGMLREFTCVCAREQTHGRGTRGRSWLSPRDAGLYLTFADPNPHPMLPDTGVLTLAAGVAAANVLERELGIPIRLKPINDLYLYQRKLGGILTESIVQGRTILAVFTGIGINIARADRPVPDATTSPIALEEAMTAEDYQRLDRARLTTAIGLALVDAHAIVWNGGDTTILEQFRIYAS
jgi:BirA family biotin operon repressor/biotin-[acetyl-CoA-carboxylase] ligase